MLRHFVGNKGTLRLRTEKPVLARDIQLGEQVFVGIALGIPVLLFDVHVVGDLHPFDEQRGYGYGEDRILHELGIQRIFPGQVPQMRVMNDNPIISFNVPAFNISGHGLAVCIL